MHVLAELGHAASESRPDVQFAKVFGTFSQTPDGGFLSPGMLSETPSILSQIGAQVLHTRGLGFLGPGMCQ